MSITKVWAVWFSATGTTEKVVTAVAKDIAAKLNVPFESHSFNTPAARKQELNFSADELVVLGVPVYAGRVPNLILPYVQGSIHAQGALAVPVVLYGNRNFDDGLMELRNVMRDNGFKPIAAGAFVGEHSFSTTLGAGRPDAEDMALAAALAEKAVERVQSGCEELVSVEGCDPIRPYYTPRDRNGDPIKDFLKAKPVTDPDKCVSCGTCAVLCPMGSIDPEDFSNVAGKCIKCCACVKKCPMGAKYFDHEGYLYHQHELEDVYGVRRAETKIF